MLLVGKYQFGELKHGETGYMVAVGCSVCSHTVTRDLWLLLLRVEKREVNGAWAVKSRPCHSVIGSPSPLKGKNAYCCASRTAIVQQKCNLGKHQVNNCRDSSAALGHPSGW